MIFFYEHYVLFTVIVETLLNCYFYIKMTLSDFVENKQLKIKDIIIKKLSSLSFLIYLSI